MNQSISLDDQNNDGNKNENNVKSATVTAATTTTINNSNQANNNRINNGNISNSSNPNNQQQNEIINSHQESGEIEEEDDDEGGLKLGLGDFVFYSVLIARAAMHDWITTCTCTIAVLTGLTLTIFLLAIYEKALPALPISIVFGIIFYFISSSTLNPLIEFLTHAPYILAKMEKINTGLIITEGCGFIYL